MKKLITLILFAISLNSIGQIEYNGKYNLLLYRGSHRIINLDAYYDISSIIPKFSIWINKHDNHTNYYADKIGMQDRYSLTDGSAGKLQVGRAISYDCDKAQYSQTIGVMPSSFRLVNNSLTFSFYLKIDSLPNSNPMNVFGTPSGTAGYNYAIVYPTTGTFTFFLKDSNGEVYLSSENNVCDGLWHHYFICLNKTDSASLYIDNELQFFKKSLAGKAFNDANIAFKIGASSSSSYDGNFYMRDFRIFNSAIIGDSLRTELYNQNYVSGSVAWWFMEGGNETNTHLLRDCFGNNDLINTNFDATSLYKNTFKSLYNKFGYSDNTYTSSDLILGDGDFSVPSEWTFVAAKFEVAGGVATFKAIDNITSRVTCNRNISFTTRDILEITFNVISGATPTINFMNQSAQVLNTKAVYEVGTHTIYVRPAFSGTGIAVNGDYTAGAFVIDEFSIKIYRPKIIQPLMDSIYPQKDLLNRNLVFKNIAKNNLLSGNNDTVYFQDSIYEIIRATDLIEQNNWYDTNGVANRIKWDDLKYEFSKQYVGNNELIIINPDSTLSDIEDLRLKAYLGITSNPVYTALGDTSGTTIEIYSTIRAILDSTSTSILKEYNQPKRTFNAQNNYIAFGLADLYFADRQYILPLNNKYGFTSTFYAQIVPNSNDYLKSTNKYPLDKLLQIERSGNYRGYHGFEHISYITSCPVMDGYNTPSNDDFRIARPDGTNELGHLITAIVDTSLTVNLRKTWLLLPDSTGAKQWKDLTDAECQSLRASISVFLMPVDGQNGEHVLQALDYLSNRYCGTTGYSVKDGNYSVRLPNTIDGNYPTNTSRILGGIFQGAATTQNHEIWERMILLYKQYITEFEGKKKESIFWATPGTTERYLFYNVENPESEWGRYIDKEHTKLPSGATEYHSTILNTNRSFIDVLKNNGFKITSACNGDGYAFHQFDNTLPLEGGLLYKKNGIKKIDNLGDGFTYMLRNTDRTISIDTIYTLLDSTNLLKSIYDYSYRNIDNYLTPGYGDNTNFYALINEIIKKNAWGVIPNVGGDTGSEDTQKNASTALVIEALYQFCKKAGIEVISHEEAYNICQNYSLPSNYNYWPNAAFNKTPLLIVESKNSPTYPDGWNDGTVAADTSLYDVTVGTIFTRQYAIPSTGGTFNYSFKGKGIGTVRIKKIRNNDTLDNIIGANYDVINTITVNSPSTYTTYTGTISIPDAAMEIYSTPATPQEASYQNYMKGYGNKICGIQIEIVLTTGNTINIKNPSIYIQ